MPMVPNFLFWSLPLFGSRYSFSIACYLGNLLYFHVKRSTIKLSSSITALPPNKQTNYLFLPLFAGSCSVNGSINSPCSRSKLSQQPITSQGLQVLFPKMPLLILTTRTLSLQFKLLSEPSLWFFLV